MEEDKHRKFLARFRELYDIIRGRRDTRSTAKIMSEPEKIETMSRLNAPEMDFVKDCKTLNELFPDDFEPMMKETNPLMEIKVSEAGKGRVEVTDLTVGLEAQRILRNLVNLSQPQQGGIRSKFKRKKEEEGQ